MRLIDTEDIYYNFASQYQKLLEHDTNETADNAYLYILYKLLLFLQIEGLRIIIYHRDKIT